MNCCGTPDVFPKDEAAFRARRQSWHETIFLTEKFKLSKLAWHYAVFPPHSSISPTENIMPHTILCRPEVNAFTVPPSCKLRLRRAA